jgi:hypothetical protein
VNTEILCPLVEWVATSTSNVAIMAKCVLFSEDERAAGGEGGAVFDFVILQDEMKGVFASI